MSVSLGYAGFCWSAQVFEPWVTFWLIRHLQAGLHQKEIVGVRANVGSCGEKEG